MIKAGFRNIRDLERLRINFNYSKGDVTEFIWSHSMLSSLKTLEITCKGSLSNASWAPVLRFIKQSTGLRSLRLKLHSCTVESTIVELLRSINRPNSVKMVALDISAAISQTAFKSLAASLSILRYVDILKLKLCVSLNPNCDLIAASLLKIGSNEFMAHGEIDIVGSPTISLSSLALTTKHLMNLRAVTKNFESFALLNLECHETALLETLPNSSCVFVIPPALKLDIGDADKNDLKESILLLLTMLRTVAGSKRTSKTILPPETIMNIARIGLNPRRFWTNQAFSVITGALLDRSTIGCLDLPLNKIHGLNALIIHCKRLELLKNEEIAHH
jgi:hypothetical protein